MKLFNRLVIPTTVLLGSLSPVGVTHAHGTTQELEAIDPHAQHQQQVVEGGEISMAEVDLSDGLTMLNRFGEQVDLRADVIGDRVVVVNFVYTNCSTVCPVTSSIFSIVQDRFDEQMGQDVALVTITVDPSRDNSHRMRSYAQNFNPNEGWSWLTGEKDTVDEALRAFGAYTPNFEDHPAMVLIGDERHSKWYRLYGFPAPEVIETRVKDLLINRSNLGS
jgi:protein SCO1